MCCFDSNIYCRKSGQHSSKDSLLFPIWELFLMQRWKGDKICCSAATFQFTGILLSLGTQFFKVKLKTNSVSFLLQSFISTLLRSSDSVRGELICYITKTHRGKVCSPLRAGSYWDFKGRIWI